LGRVLVGGVLGVPLDGGEPAGGAGEFEAFHRAVGGPRRDRRAGSGAVHSLVVVAGGVRFLGAGGPFEEGAGPDRHRVQLVAVVLNSAKRRPVEVTPA
jgi:hypothetical protein